MSTQVRYHTCLYGEPVDYDHVLWVMDQKRRRVSEASPAVPTATGSLRPVEVRDAGAGAQND